MRKNKDRHKRRRLRWIVVGAIVAAALLLGWCGRGWFGGGSSGDEAQTEQKSEVRPALSVPADAADAARCRVRVDETGLTVNGRASTVDEAVGACRGAREAELITTGMARYGTVDAVDKALRGAGVRIFHAGAKPDEPAE